MPDLKGAIPLLPILTQRPPPATAGASDAAGIDRAAALGPVLFRLAESEASFGLDKAVAQAYLDSSAARELSEGLGCGAGLINPDLAKQAGGAAPMGLVAAFENARRAFTATVHRKMVEAAARLLGPDFFALAARWAAGHFEADFALAARDDVARQYLDQLLGLGPIPIYNRPPADFAWSENAASLSLRDRLLRAHREQALGMLSSGAAVATGVREFEVGRVPINAGLWRGASPFPREGAIVFGDRAGKTKLFDVQFSRASDLPAADPKCAIAAAAPPRSVAKRGELEGFVRKRLEENREKSLQDGPWPAAAWICQLVCRPDGVPWKLDTIRRHALNAWPDLVAGRKL